ncbi:unnamed protein product [Thlaspi arvense]|uniref:Protein kinase domain-containing protein n=1 Tax=Thlaspi arvense TaxID=13288 RepID=A0AAU9SBD0_THLAR|nr:unnamed protein product [Thlaspi arvense]
MSMEYAAAGSLTSFMQTRSLSDTMIKDFTRMIFRGLVSVHNHGYVHCDLKPDNLLVFPRQEDDDVGGGGVKEVSYELKISDFGMSTKVGEDFGFWEFDSPFLGTPLYMLPESIHYSVAEEPLDLWSLGCVVLEMYTGKPPWPFENSKKLLRHLSNEEAPEIPESLPWDARQFLQTCFAKNPVERGSASGLLNHQFLFKKVSDQRKVMVTGTGGKRKSVLVLNFEDIMKKPLRVRIIPPKPPQFKKILNRPLKLKIIPPKPPGCNLVSDQ